MTDYIKIYKEIFAIRNYNTRQPRNPSYDLARAAINKVNPKTIVDIGTGRGCFLPFIPKEIKVTTVDLDKFHGVACDFVQADLSTKAGRLAIGHLKADMLTCLGVLEHLEESFIVAAIGALSKVAPKAAVYVANHSDIIGGIELHTLCRPYSWWKEMLEKYYIVTCESDQCRGRSHFYELDVKQI